MERSGDVETGMSSILFASSGTLSEWLSRAISFICNKTVHTAGHNINVGVLFAKATLKICQSVESIFYFFSYILHSYKMSRVTTMTCEMKKMSD